MELARRDDVGLFVHSKLINGVLEGVAEFSDLSIDRKAVENDRNLDPIAISIRSIDDSRHLIIYTLQVENKV